MKNIINKLFIGGITGVFVSSLISIYISYTIGKGEFFPCSPHLSTAMGNELNATLFQFISSFILGAVFSISSMVFSINRLNLLSQSIIFCIITSSAYIFTSYKNFWFKRNFHDIFIHFIVYFLIFVFIWVVTYIITYFNIKKINNTL